MTIRYILFLVLWILAHIVQAQDICGDMLDNDGDGEIDEDCASFPCDGTLFQTFKSGGMVGLYQVETNPVSFTLLADLSAQGVVDIDATAYNPINNMIYGINLRPPYQLYCIDKNYVVTYLGNVSGLPGSLFYSGCIGPNGEYWVSGTDQALYRINIATRSATFVNTMGHRSSDKAYNPIDGMLYSWKGRLIQIDPVTGNDTPVGSFNGWDDLRSLYFNARGDLIGYGRQSSGPYTLIKIDPNTGVVTPLGQGPSAPNSSDGCSCSFGVEMTKEIVGTPQAGGKFKYKFTLYNGGLVTLQNIQFQDLLSNGLTWTTEPQNVEGLSIFSTNISAKPNASFRIDVLPVGKSSFELEVAVPCDFVGGVYSNQAELTNIPGRSQAQLSDDPTTGAINDPTEVTIPTGVIDIQIQSTNSICERTSGSLTPIVSGGARPYQFAWSQGSQDSLAANLPVGEYTLTVTSATGCQTTKTASVLREVAEPIPALTGQDAQCKDLANGQIWVDSVAGGYAPYRYALAGQDYQENTQFDGLRAGTYTIYVKDQYGCVGNQRLTIAEPSFKLDLQLPNDTVILLGDEIPIEITKNTLTPVTYEWSTTEGLRCLDCEVAYASPTQKSTIYTLIGTDVQGCQDTATMQILVNKRPRTFIPNAFSPNGDGVNDQLIIYSAGDVERVRSWRIYDRWGNLVFAQKDFPPNFEAYAWNGEFRGKPLKTGVYVYVAELAMKDGERKLLKGDLTLLR